METTNNLEANQALQNLNNQSKKRSDNFISNDDQLVKELLINCERTILYDVDNIASKNARILIHKINNKNFLINQLKWHNNNIAKLNKTTYNNKIILESAIDYLDCLQQGINYKDTLDVNYSFCIQSYVKTIEILKNKIN